MSPVIYNFVNELIKENIISTFKFNDETYLILEDSEIIKKIDAVTQNVKTDQVLLSNQISFLSASSLLINGNTIIEKTIYKEDNKKAYNSLIKNILIQSLSDKKTYKKNFKIFDLVQYRVISSSEKIACKITKYQTRKDNIDSLRSSQFAESASYMGSKRSLANFIIEAISENVSDNSYIVDLMCGSGAASSAFNLFWPTYASDAQQFCRILAKVQGGGYSLQKAKHTIDKLVPQFNKNVSLLENKINNFITEEDEIFHMDSLESALNKYQKLVYDFPTYPGTKNSSYWNPTREIKKYRTNNNSLPYCLFTAYFSNLYFGIRQSVEIDSIRYAISQLDNDLDKTWALGALVASISKVATTYGGHFAQPKYKSPDVFNRKNLLKIIDKRQLSIFHEFTVRLLNLSSESEKYKNEIKLVVGPWQLALNNIKSELVNKEVLVYLDAPYKREEYSRYYHTLETLIAYNYPNSIGNGKTPDIKKDERFKSEFSTRNINNLNSIFIKVISNILNQKYKCAWSYSNTGSANIDIIIDTIKLKYKCDVKVYSIPYKHKSHGGRVNKEVIEYLIFFIP